MTEFIDKLLSSMSTKFNAASNLVEINLNEDKTLKWRGLHNNQYAAVKKKKDGKRTTAHSSNRTADPPPLMNDSSNSSSKSSTTTIATTTATANANKKPNNASDIDTTNVTIADAKLIDEIDIPNELNSLSDKTDKNNDDTINNDMAKDNINENKSDLRPFRRTLRRKQNVDEANDDINFVSQTNKRIGRPKRHASASSSVHENGSISPKRDEKLTTDIVTNSESITTRRRGRAKKLENDATTESLKILDESNSSGVAAVASLAKNHLEQKNSVIQESDDSTSVSQPSQPLKLRRSERTLHASSSNDQKDLTAQNVTTEITADQTVIDHSVADTESHKKYRKRTIDERKSQEIIGGVVTTEHKFDASSAAEKSQATESEIKSENQTDLEMEKVELLPLDSSNVMIESKADINDDETVADSAMSIPRKRGRKPGTKLKPKVDLKVNMTIATRNSPVKKSPRFSSDESPFTYSIPKKDKPEQAPPQQRLSRRIKPTPKILANEELRQGFEIQNNARLSLSNEHLDNEHERSPIQEVPIQVQTQVQQIQETTRVEPETSQNGAITVDEGKRSPQTPPKRQSSSPLNSNEFVRPVRRPCPDPEQFLNEIKQAKINLHRSPEDNKKLNLKQKKRLFKLKEKHLQKLGLRKVSKSSCKNASSDSNAETDDNEEFVPAKKINVGRPSVTLRVRGQKDIVIYDKHILPTKPLKDKSKKSTKTPAPPKLIDQLDHHSKELISRNPEISLISSTKHKLSHGSGTTMGNGNQQQQLTSEVTLSIRKESDSNICLCNKTSKYYTRKTEDTYCSAIDQIENQRVGCGNEVNGDLLNLLRPSVRVSYMLLCDSHKKRLYSHNCCAGCGMFCTQGRFIICAKNHFFHRDCATKFILNGPFNPQNPDYTYPTLVLKCPHCGIDAPERESSITMRCGSVPLFTTSQKKLPKAAKMSIGEHSYRTIKSREESCLLEIEKLVPESVTSILIRAQNRIPFTDGRSFTNKDVFYAITKDDIDRMAEIIASGFDITTPIKEFHNGTCLHLASNFGSITMTQLILNRVSSIDIFNLFDNKLRTAVMCSIIGGKNDALKLLVQCGADITIKGTDGMTALHLAAKNGNLKAIHIMLDNYRNSASLYHLEKFLNTSDDGGWTAIVWAADLGNSEMVSALLNCGANVNICDAENNTALHWATLSDNIETVMLLLQNGCNLGTQNINGDTPLHIACRKGNVRISLFLLAHGANLDITNNANEAPYDCIPDENGPCGRAIFFNLQIRNIAGLPEQNIICQDISNGREIYPIQIVGRKKYRNTRPASTQSETDNDQLIPDFKYITKTILLQNAIQIDQRVLQMRICSCLDNCTAQNCQCSEISIQNWYDSDGRLNSDFNFHDPAMIFECNDVCGCNKLLCKNRVVQNSSKQALQIFECNERVKGFGVRGLTKIPRGTFVSQYTGEILTDIEADRRGDDSYFFDLGASEHCIDANFYGNVSRFFNHSCEANMVPIRVYFEHQDLRFPKIAFFASKDIEAGEELTFDYGEKFWIAKYKLFTCHCGTVSCRFSDKTVAKTLEEFNQRSS